MESVSFRAMGSPCRITVDAGRSCLAGQARSRVEQLEQLWSRFLPTSEVSQLNRRPGALTIVSEETYDLVSRAQEARHLTGGRFNPLMLGQLRRLGYDSPWRGLGPTRSPRPTEPATTESIELIPEIRGVRIPEGTAFDPGGIGKGLAADRITDWLWSRGATTTSVELGGDLRVEGTCWYDHDWRIGVADPFDDEREAAIFRPSNGAVTTSSTRRRSWTAGGRHLHHLLDPVTGVPANTDLVAVTTCAATAWWAEIAAKTTLIANSGEARAVLERLATPGMAVTASGETLVFDGVEDPTLEAVGR